MGRAVNKVFLSRRTSVLDKARERRKDCFLLRERNADPTRLYGGPSGATERVRLFVPPLGKATSTTCEARLDSLALSDSESYFIYRMAHKAQWYIAAIFRLPLRGQRWN